MGLQEWRRWELSDSDYQLRISRQFWVRGLGFRVWGSGFRVQGLGLRFCGQGGVPESIGALKGVICHSVVSVEGPLPISRGLWFGVYRVTGFGFRD